MLFLGLGTGVGSALIVNNSVVPMELGHLPYKQGTYEDYLGLRGLKRLGINKWRDHFRDVVARFISALEVDEVVVGGGNVSKLDKMPHGCRAGDNALAFVGGFRMWAADGRKTQGPSRGSSRDHKRSLAKTRSHRPLQEHAAGAKR